MPVPMPTPELLLDASAFCAAVTYHLNLDLLGVIFQAHVWLQDSSRSRSS